MCPLHDLPSFPLSESLPYEGTESFLGWSHPLSPTRSDVRKQGTQATPIGASDGKSSLITVHKVSTHLQRNGRGYTEEQQLEKMVTYLSVSPTHIVDSPRPPRHPP